MATCGYYLPAALALISARAERLGNRTGPSAADRAYGRAYRAAKAAILALRRPAVTPSPP